MELIGFPISLSRFDLLQTPQRLATRAKDLLQYLNKSIRIMGDYVATKPVRTSNGKEMAFGTFVDENGNFFDTTHFPPALAKYPFQGGGIYLILGKVVEEFGFPSIEVEKMARLSYLKNPIAV
jgi:DNA polymerase-3 subunit alpha